MNSPFTDSFDVASESSLNDSFMLELSTLGPFAEPEHVQPLNEGYDYALESENIFHEEGDMESTSVELLNELSADQLRQAVELNEKYKKLYRWEAYLLPILGIMKVDSGTVTGALTDPKKFAQAFADWQDKNNIMTPTKGVLGLNSWSHLQKLLGFHNLSNRYHIDVQKAIEENKRQATKHWGRERDNIYSLLSMHKVLGIALPLSDEYFAYAVAEFQALKKLDVDGILGPATLTSLKVIPQIKAPINILTPSKWQTLIPGTAYDSVETLIDGKQTFERMVQAIRTAKASGHYIYILGWMFDIDFPLVQKDPSTSMRQLLETASKQDVEVRVMIWDNPFYTSEIATAKAFIDKLPNASMIKDDATYGSPHIEKALAWVREKMDEGSDLLNKIDAWKALHAQVKALKNEGSHHEKILIVKRNEGLTAFCGGVDINPNRLDGLPGNLDGALRSTTLHDVHCQVTGEAAFQLLQRFLFRWKNYSESSIWLRPYTLISLRGANETRTSVMQPQTHLNNYSHVKVLHTYNHPSNSTIKSRTIRDTVRLAIRHARETIYMEDQYMISPEIATWLNAKVKERNFIKLTIRTQDDMFAADDLLFPHFMRRRFEKLLNDGLTSEQQKKISIEILNPGILPPFRRKIHSKVWIIDSESDGLAIIGSANCNRRSMTHDSETAIVVFEDGEKKGKLPQLLEQGLRSVPFNTWTKYSHNLSVFDIDVKIMKNPVFAGASMTLGVASANTLMLYAYLPKLWVELRKIVDPYNDPSIIENEIDNEDQQPQFQLLEDSLQSHLENVNEISDDEAIPESIYDESEAITEEIEQEGSSLKKVCEGRVCWLKSIMNQHLGTNFADNNNLDETTKRTLREWQTRLGIKPTGQLDGVTERTLLELDTLKRFKGSADESTADQLIGEAKTRIEDWTSRAVVEKKEITNEYRDPRKLWAFVLHQLAFKRRSKITRQFSDPSSYLKTGAHFCIMFDGRIVQLHPLSRLIWHAQRLSGRSVAVEFEGNFPNIYGQWWADPTESVVNKDKPTQAQFDSGRFLTRYLKYLLGTTHIFAHAQAWRSRSNDPGPDIWVNVGQWAINTLGLTDGGASFKIDSGNAILPAWRTWKSSSPVITKEQEEDLEIDIPEDMTLLADEESTPETIDEGYGEEIDQHFEMDDLLKDWSTTIALNKRYSQHLGWSNVQDKINDLLLPFSGLKNVSLAPEAFAQALAAWQRQQGYPEKECDGVLGPKSWKEIQKFIGTKITAPLVQGNLAIGALGTLIVSVSLPSIPNDFREYSFTTEDALWLARFVEGEAGGKDDADSHAVIWAMFNRFGSVRHLVPSWKNFAVFLQKYSTTLQPVLNNVDAARRVWDNNKRDPARFPIVQGVGKYPGTTVDRVQYKKHIDLQQKKWDAFKPYVRDMVTRILTGQITNPGIGIATHFLSSYVLLKAKRRKEGIVEEPSTEEWRQYTLEVASNKKLYWIGERGTLNQKKNAFFIQPKFKDVSPDSISVVMGKKDLEQRDYEFMDEIEYLDALEIENQ